MHNLAPARARLTNFLFFALIPTEAAATRITNLTAQLRTQHKLKARAIPPPPPSACTLRSTISACSMAFPQPSYNTLTQPPRPSRCRQSTSCSIASKAFPAAAQNVLSYSRARPAHPLIALETGLGNALKIAGISLDRHRDFAPHVTLLYDELRIAPSVVEPITWTAREFALIRSHLGKSRHEVLSRWPLAS